jgi:hypothetical protein
MNTFGPQVGQVYIDPLLANISIAYQNDTYMADMIFPEVQVAKISGFYFVYDKSKFVVANDLRAPSTRANRVDYGLTKEPYGPLVEHSLEQDIPDEVVDQAMAPLDPNVDATENVTDRILLSKELDAFNQCTDTAVITQNVTLSGSSQWDQYATSDPIGDVKTARDTVKKAVLKMPNRLLLGYEVFSDLQNHPEIIERIKYSQLGVVTAELLAEIFVIEEVWIADAEQNVANENQDPDMEYIWGKNAWVFYINPAPAIRKVSFGYTFRRGPRQVERWDERWVKAQFVRVTDWYEQKIVAAPAAYFIQNAIS